MTKEELREHCEKQVKACEMWAKHRGQEPSGKVYEEHKLILDLIKLSEQQPCDDCVSRQAVIDLINADWKYEGLELSINELPSVTPTRKVGKWIYHFERDDYNDYENEYYECPFCHDLGGDKDYHYCPVCGNKVKGVEDGSN